MAQRQSSRRRPERVPGVRQPRPGSKAYAREAEANLRERGLLKAAPEPAAAEFKPREALRRAGWEAADEGAKTVGLAQDAGRRASRYLAGDPQLRYLAPVTIGELALYAAASILGLALLEAALRGRGPAGVERLFALMGSGIRRLFSPEDPLVGATVPPEFRAGAGLGGSAGATTGAGASSEDSEPAGVTQGGVYPLGKRGAVIGTPNAGTHTLGNWQSDNAVDLKVPVGTPVYAVTDGVISPTLGFGPTGQGGRFEGSRLHLENGKTFFYAHLSRITVRRGQRVRAGQLIGYSGSANGVGHLHFSVNEGSIFSWVQSRLRQLAETVS